VKYLRGGGIFNDHFIANLLLRVLAWYYSEYRTNKL